MTLPNRPRQASAFRLEELDGEILLYHPGLTKAIRLNASAALVWRLCDGERTAGDIARLLREAYPEAAETIEADVDVALACLADQGALESA